MGPLGGEGSSNGAGLRGRIVNATWSDYLRPRFQAEYRPEADCVIKTITYDSLYFFNPQTLIFQVLTNLR